MKLIFSTFIMNVSVFHYYYVLKNLEIFLLMDSCGIRMTFKLKMTRAFVMQLSNLCMYILSTKCWNKIFD